MTKTPIDSRTISSSSAKIGFFRGRELGVLIALVLLSAAFSVLSPRFLTTENLMNIMRQVSIVGIISMGMTMVIVSGEIDLSVGAIYGLAAMVAGAFMMSGTPVIISCLMGLLAGIATGLLNGVLVAFVRIPSLIATLGVLNIARGLALIITGGGVVNLMSKRVVTDPFVDVFLMLGKGKTFGIVPNLAVIFLLVAVISYFVFHKTLLGFNMKAVGGNANAARVSGVSVRLVRLSAFVICGFLAGLAGLLNFAFLEASQGTMGQGLELDVIAATIIGGASLSGGEATIPGTVIGVLIMGVLRNGLVLMGVTPFLQIVIVGVVIIVAVAIDVWTRK